MKKIIFLFISILLLSSCSTIYYKKSEILSRQTNIKALQEKLNEAVIKDVDVLSPTQFEKAEQKLNQAIDIAQKNKDPDVSSPTAQEGLIILEKAFATATDAKEIFNETLEKRVEAQNAKAHLLFEKEWLELENRFKKASRSFENGDRATAVGANGTLSRNYEDLEVRALKADISMQAEVAYAKALEIGANKLAPITFSNAKQELDIAKKIIDVEKTNYDKAQYHAERARYLALRAKGLAELAIMFKKEKLSEEQIGLWYQDQLEKIYKPFNEKIMFDLSNNDLILSLQERSRHNMDYISNLEQRNQNAEKKIASLNDKVASTLGENEKIRLKRSVLEENFNSITDLFNKEEAEVLKSGNDIIIRSFGFSFPVGEAELESRNFGLLNKIVSAILKFPKSNIVVHGHTDVTGSLSLNQQLSEQRAKNIAEFLIKVAGIDASRVSSVGFGPQRPLANNNTAKGRAKNRRIEVIIKDV